MRAIDAVVIYDYSLDMAPNTLRTVLWIKAADKDYRAFPPKAQARAIWP